MKKRPMWHTHLVGAMTIASAAMTFYAVDVDNTWLVVLFAWLCGASGAHVNRDFQDRKLVDEINASDPMRNITVTSSADPEYMCPNCLTPWKCNHPHHPQSCDAWQDEGCGKFEIEYCDCGAMDDVEA